MTQAGSKPQMLTIPQLEKLRILPGQAIRRLVAEGRIPTVDIGNRRYINLAVFEQYLSCQSAEFQQGRASNGQQDL
ncbi:MAG: helix-turn-helix domain-containing protein [Clostridiales bacterium]|nr:helix-turn-helix domain-containing protein [Clostridiales bacterium]